MRTIEYVTTHTGLKVMEPFFMRTCFFHKGVVFLLSVVEGNSFWTTHFTQDTENRRMKVYGPMFRQEHEEQLQRFYDEWKQNEVEPDPRLITIDDRTSESKGIIRALRAGSHD